MKTLEILRFSIGKKGLKRNSLFLASLFIGLALIFQTLSAQIKQPPQRENILSESVYLRDTRLGIQLKQEHKSIGYKLFRAEAISFGLQGIGYGMLALMPTSVTLWDYDHIAENYKRAWTQPPVLDHDSWYFNWLGHPLTGALHYNALRSQGVPMIYCFAFSSAQSLMWEFLIECMHERPSIQDLAITSTVGSLIGEGFHRATLGMRRNGFQWYEMIIVTLINPTYLINNGYH